MSSRKCVFTVVAAIGLLVSPFAWTTVFAQGNLLNLTQWPVSQGGNDHWYGVLPVAQSYDQNVTEAATFTQGTDIGYLATITSPEENNFIVQFVLNGLGPVPDDQLFLGATIACGIVSWDSGEPVSFINWQPGEVSRVSGSVLMRAGGDPSVAGKWRDQSSASAYALVEIGSPTISSPANELVNLVQWPIAEGGNDHWYAVIAKTMPWIYHVNYARTLLHDTAHGYLATIRTPEENQFITQHVIAGVTPNAVTEEFYLGAQREGSSSFRWLTNEAIGYANWSGGEPNGDGIGVGMWGDNSGHTMGLWNDVPGDTAGLDCFHMLWSVVEWGPLDSGTTPTGLYHLVQWPSAQGGNDHWYGILMQSDSWQYQNTNAQSQSHDGLTGYLATVTSADENQFILDSLLGTVGQGLLSETYFLGGQRACSQFGWVTGEAYSYSNWNVLGQKPTESNIYMYSQTASGKTAGAWDASDNPGPMICPAIVEFGPHDTLTLDTIVNLVQWTTSQGGNDHWYAVVNKARPWISQYEFAHALVHNGERGYLATVTSAEENQFIVDSIMAQLYPNAIIDEFYLGARRPAKDSAFQWLTGEAMSYGNWASGEPNGDGPAMALWGKSSGRTLGGWNDVPEDTLGIDCYHQIYAIVEWGGIDQSAHEFVLGNVDCDPTNRIDISDLTKLIDYAFVNRSRWNFLWCPDAANIDLDSQHQIDIADITRIIDYLYISMEPLGGYK